MSIVICVKDALEAFRLCIESVITCTPKPFQLVVVNDGSGLETSKFINSVQKRHFDLKIINNSRSIGYTKSVNAGIVACDGDYIILLNSDTIVPPEWDGRLIRALNECPKTAIVSPLSNAAHYQSIPRIHDRSGGYCVNLLPSNCGLSVFASMLRKEFSGKTVKVHLLNGFCMCMRASAIQNIGLFDEQAFPIGYGEEIDLCIRAAKAGWDMKVVLDAYVYHHKTQSFAQEERIKLVANGNKTLFDLYGEYRIRGIFRDMGKNPELREVREVVFKKFYNSA